MKVRTLRRHGNAHKPQYVKNVGRKYEVSERDGRNLIAAGLVAEDAAEDQD
ncbi:hypothetical protein [Qipengyuania huizhouensis]|uniref:hypothetical protein n=1 Tax=Qipengyuania huizhouensis TaxID=2867245 RepID=UPI001C87F39E|nr:hypothetical protein [Qipengyuania huizhouensis]MBX7459553.1 hypothetical protein [Qipengyuania huizhouensis]